MSQYNKFAYIYDEIMETMLDYDSWAIKIDKWAKRFGKNIEKVCELGCGTGTITWKMAEAGYDIMGIDLSEQMLMMANDKQIKVEKQPFFVHQDVTKLELIDDVDMVISTGDCFNYVKPEEFHKVLEGVNKYLLMGGLFVFDMNTKRKFKYSMGNRRITEIEENYAYIWDNFYDEEKNVNEYIVNYFIKNSDGTYERTTEEHREYAYNVEWLKKLLAKYGFEIIEIYDDYSDFLMNTNTERMCFVTRLIKK